MRFKLLFPILLLAALAHGATNVVLITMDTTRADALSCYGQKGIRTPTLDGLAAASHRFQVVYTPVPQTLPAHVSILTGLYPFHHGVRDNMINALPQGQKTLAVLLKAGGYNTAAILGAAVLDRRFGLAQGFDSYDDAFEPYMPARKAGDVTDRALEVLKTLKSPYFLWVHYYDPHHPYNPPSDVRAPTPYLGEVVYMDREMGRLLKVLDPKQTLIVAVGDHGESLHEHKEMEHGLLLYEPAVRVPLLIHRPGQTTPETHAAAVSTVSVFSTILDLLGRPAPAQSDGPALFGKTAPGPLYLETLYPLFSFRWSPLRALVAWPYKMILSATGPELYAVDADPREAHDLAAVDAKRASELRKTLERLCPEPLLEAKQAKAGEMPDELKKQLQSLGYMDGTGADTSAPAGRTLLNPRDVADLPEFLLYTGPQWVKEKRFKELLGRIKEILHVDPYNFSAMNLAGTAYWEEGNNERAHDIFLKAAEAAPDCYYIIGNLGRSYYNLKKLADSEKTLRRALELNPRYPEGYVYLFDTLLAEGKAEAAEADLRRAEAQGVAHPRLTYDRGLMLVQKGRCKEAIPLFEKALKDDPEQPESLGNLAYCLNLYGEAEKAWVYIERGMKAAPADSKMYAAAFTIAMELGRREDARRCAVQYLKLNPDPERAQSMRTAFPDLP